MVTITLETPITRGDSQITSVALRRPTAGTLRGLLMLNLMQGDAAAVADLLPRISEPPLLPHEIQRMDASDFTACMVEVVNFLLPKSMLPGG
ncbi:MAG: phage tail assembly protein [Proteobacteria bacterium]|nr:phage tail assembly protein [Pseudomonadota bacterium]